MNFKGQSRSTWGVFWCVHVQCMREGGKSGEREGEKTSAGKKRSVAHLLMHSRHTNTTDSSFPSCLFPSKKTHSRVACNIAHSDDSGHRRFATVRSLHGYHVSQVNLLQTLFSLHHTPTQGPWKASRHLARKAKTPMPACTPPTICLF